MFNNLAPSLGDDQIGDFPQRFPLEQQKIGPEFSVFHMKMKNFANFYTLHSLRISRLRSLKKRTNQEESQHLNLFHKVKYKNIARFATLNRAQIAGNKYRALADIYWFLQKIVLFVLQSQIQISSFQSYFALRFVHLQLS